jgi:hypothetical protein
MSQRIVTLCKLANPDVNIKWLKSVLSNDEMPVVDHYKTPFVLYWAQWHDPWLSIGEYELYMPQMLDVNPKAIDDSLYSFECTVELASNLKKALRKKHQYNEQRWFYWHLNEALKAYDNINIETRLFYKLSFNVYKLWRR